MSCELPRFSSYSRTLVRWHAVTHLWPTILACPPLPGGPCGHTGSAHSRPQLSTSLCPYLLVSARLQQDHRCEASRTARARTADANGLFRSGCDTAGKLRLYRPSHCRIDSAAAAARSLDPARARAFLGEQPYGDITTAIRRGVCACGAVRCVLSRRAAAATLEGARGLLAVFAAHGTSTARTFERRCAPAHAFSAGLMGGLTR